MKNYKSKILFSLLGVCLFVGVERLCHRATDGFSVTRIRSDFSYPSECISPELTAQEIAEVEEIFNQPFTYLASGSQCFAFISHDRKVVLKLFKNHRFCNLASLCNKKRKEKRIESFKDALQSCLFSYNLFKNETGLLYLHLAKTQNLPFQVKLIDRLNIHHTVDLNNRQFHLQKCATSVPNYLLQLRAKGDHELAKEAIDNLLSMSERRSLLGYNDKDPHLIYNFGFIENKPVQIDAAGFSKNMSRNRRRFYNSEIHKIRAKAMPWIEKNYPEIAAHTRNQITALSDE